MTQTQTQAQEGHKRKHNHKKVIFSGRLPLLLQEGSPTSTAITTYTILPPAITAVSATPASTAATIPTSPTITTNHYSKSCSTHHGISNISQQCRARGHEATTDAAHGGIWCRRLVWRVFLRIGPFWVPFWVEQRVRWDPRATVRAENDGRQAQILAQQTVASRQQQTLYSNAVVPTYY